MFYLFFSNKYVKNKTLIILTIVYLKIFWQFLASGYSLICKDFLTLVTSLFIINYKLIFFLQNMTCHVFFNLKLFQSEYIILWSKNQLDIKKMWFVFLSNSIKVVVNPYIKLRKSKVTYFYFVNNLSQFDRSKYVWIYFYLFNNYLLKLIFKVEY